ncbi:hypothetical protein [Serratia liquefaciens]|nr:hypothetical protein [Serratia liquefaciens]
MADPTLQQQGVMVIIGMNVAPLWGEHGCFAASTVFKTQPHLDAGAA